MAAEDHLVSIGRGDKLQLLGAFAEEEPITLQCSAVHCRTVQCSEVQYRAFAEKEPVATEIQFLFLS